MIEHVKTTIFISVSGTRGIVFHNTIFEYFSQIEASEAKINENKEFWLAERGSFFTHLCFPSFFLFINLTRRKTEGFFQECHLLFFSLLPYQTECWSSALAIWFCDLGGWSGEGVAQLSQLSSSLKVYKIKWLAGNIN